MQDYVSDLELNCNNNHDNDWTKLKCWIFVLPFLVSLTGKIAS